MASLDLKDAYYHVPIHRDFKRYLRVAVQIGSQVVHLQYQALPFGINIAPRVFTKLIAEMAAHIREESGIFIPYLDDFLLIGDSYDLVRSQLNRTLGILSKLGWQLNPEKSSLVPAQIKTVSRDSDKFHRTEAHSTHSKSRKNQSGGHRCPYKLQCDN